MRQQQLLFYLFGIVFLFGDFISLKAQQVEFREEPAISRLIEMTIQANRDPSHKIDVWRIQISATVDRRQMETAKATFKRRYSWFNIVNTYSEPYYKLQVGAYHQRSRAEAVLYQLKKDYPGAYLVRDKVRLSELTD